MKILVLDTIHGGAVLAEALAAAGHEVDAVDVYRGREGIPVEEAARKRYDLVVAPVHLDPAHPLLGAAPRAVTHHEAVALLLAGRRPSPLVEVTGMRGKTTTAAALAHILPGPGVLHTSMGTFACPEGCLFWKRSITPASVLAAAEEAKKIDGWCVAEESLGVSGAGDLAVLTSGEDYPVAAGKKSALAEKVRSLARARAVLVPPGVTVPGALDAGTIAAVAGTACTYSHGGIEGRFENPLLALTGYRTPLQIAAAAACLLGADPAGLASFRPLPGRMAVSHAGKALVVDAASSGACREVAVDAAAYARALGGARPLVLVIGTEGQTICEGFPEGEVAAAVEAIGPDSTVLVGDYPGLAGTPAPDLAAGYAIAQTLTGGGTIVLAVKTWR
ncbi:MAG: coenzyme F430 synthase [Methanofollis sp.]|uniref:coenzyme F430 synthase n=1 Tax=Methanofollis sp. TaxID=2052835 RepID=UPI00261C25F3|nr:coenzyme F430 synthase [Methanofollis sp.]MDD4254244.1 coenzyme F430 synthase [Methanofollis sp.]